LSKKLLSEAILTAMINDTAYWIWNTRQKDIPAIIELPHPKYKAP